MYQCIFFQNLSDVQIIQAFLNCGMSAPTPDNVDVQLFRRCTTKNMETAEIGACILYNEEEEVYNWPIL